MYSTEGAARHASRTADASASSPLRADGSDVSEVRSMLWTGHPSSTYSRAGPRSAWPSPTAPPTSSRGRNVGRSSRSTSGVWPPRATAPAGPAAEPSESEAQQPPPASSPEVDSLPLSLLWPTMLPPPLPSRRRLPMLPRRRDRGMPPDRPLAAPGPACVAADRAPAANPCGKTCRRIPTASSSGRASSAASRAGSGRAYVRAARWLAGTSVLIAAEKSRARTERAATSIASLAEES